MSLTKSVLSVWNAGNGKPLTVEQVHSLADHIHRYLLPYAAAHDEDPATLAEIVEIDRMVSVGMTAVRNVQDRLRYRDALLDILAGAEQQSQSHADIVVKCREALEGENEPNANV